MNRRTRFVVVVVCFAAVSGGGTAFGQVADGSIGTVQVAPPSVDASASVSAAPSANANLNVEPPARGSQTANNSVGTVQAGGSGAQRARGSVGTVQVHVPGTRARLGAAPSVRRNGIDPNTTVSVSIDPARGGSQTATNSIGTAQVGSGPQTADRSVGTVQVAQPGVEVRASLAGPLRPDMPDGSLSREVATVALTVDPAEGGPQTATDSIGTVQVVGGSTATPSTSPSSTSVTPGGVAGIAATSGSSGSGAATRADPAAPTASPLGREKSRALTALGVLKELPFTGVALVASVLAGLTLLLAGLAVRTRIARTAA